MAGLSPDTVKLIDRLFPQEQRAEVAEILVRECGDNLPLTGPSPGGSHERIRFAVLKLSEGNLARLREMVRHANIDWRDVLVWAGFGSSLTAHQEWARAVLTPPAPAP